MRALAAAGRSPYIAAITDRDDESGFAVKPRSPAMSTSTVIILAVIVVIVIWAIGIYNSLVSMRQRVNQAYADVDVQLRQRHDLVPNLVETVKGYAAHERGTLDEVVKAQCGDDRARPGAAGGR